VAWNFYEMRRFGTPRQTPKKIISNAIIIQRRSNYCKKKKKRTDRKIPTEPRGHFKRNLKRFNWSPNLSSQINKRP
jgi:hypothetical protein